jgi:hypothetical protein
MYVSVLIYLFYLRAGLSMAYRIEVYKTVADPDSLNPDQDLGILQKSGSGFETYKRGFMEK